MATLLQRLRERKLVQWGTAYLAGAFAACQILDAVSEPLGLTTLMLRGVLVLLGAGFLVTLTLAWYHGEQGRQTVSGPELLVVALLFVIAGTGIALVQGAGGTAEAVARNRRGPPSGPPEAGAPSVAVLPFTDMSAAGDQRYFGDGIAEEILNSLARISGLQVAARTSAFQLRDENVATVGVQLGVANVLEGSVRRDGDRVRVTAQLIQVADGFHLWSETFDRVVTDVFAIQEEIAEAIAGALKVELGLHPTGVRARGLTDDMQAYDLYLMGRDRWTVRSPRTAREAIGYFERAIEQDSSFALAYSGLADAWMTLKWYDPTVVPRDAYERAKPAALRAYELSPNLGESHATLGWIAYVYEWDWETADRHMREAVRLAPGYAPGHQWYSHLLWFRGEYESSLREIRMAQTLDPLSNGLDWAEGIRLSNLNRTEEARAAFDRAVLRSPVIPYALGEYALNLLVIEPRDPARAAELAAQASTAFGYPEPERIQATVLGLSDGAASMAGWGAVLDDLARRSVLTRPDLLVWYGLPGLADVYFDVLAEAVNTRHPWVVSAPPYVAAYAPELTQDPRWQAFLERINYPSGVPGGEGPP